MHQSTITFKPVFQADDRFSFAHASALLPIENGNALACFWFSGSLEGHADVVIRQSTLRPTQRPGLAGPFWSTPTVTVDEPGRPAGNPVAQLDRYGRILLYYVLFPPRAAKRSVLYVRESQDGGLNWGDPRILTQRPGYWPRHPVIVTRNGRWLLPLCNVHTRPPESMVWISDDQGRNWREVVIPDSQKRIQPALVELGDGRLVAYLRDMSCEAIYQSFSEDNGESWLPPVKTVLPNNNSGFSFLRTGDGCLAAAYNDGTDRYNRSRISLSLSSDEGVSWSDKRYLTPFDDLRAARSQISYPFLAESASGQLHLSLTYRSHTILHACFDPQWITSNNKRLAVPPAEIYVRPPYDLRRLHLNEPVYTGDKATLIVDAPDFLAGSLAICPDRVKSGQESGNAFTVVLNRDAEAYVCIDCRVGDTPPWISDFRRSELRVNTTGGSFNVFHCNLSKGEHRFGHLTAAADQSFEPWFGFLLPKNEVPKI